MSMEGKKKLQSVWNFNPPTSSPDMTAGSVHGSVSLRSALRPNPARQRRQTLAHLFLLSTIMDVPGKRGQVHNQHHLGKRDLNFRRWDAVDKVDDMTEV